MGMPWPLSCIWWRNTCANIHWWRAALLSRLGRKHMHGVLSKMPSGNPVLLRSSCTGTSSRRRTGAYALAMAYV